MNTAKKKVELEGSIEEFGLSDIVQFLSGSEKTGKLRMVNSNAGVQGEISFEKGSVVHAEAGGVVGEDAFFELLVWTDGQFTFEPDTAASEKKTVRQNSTNLLLEGARRKDEWDVVSKHIPDMSHVPEFVLPNESETGRQITLNTNEWVVLSKIDGQRSMKDVAAAAGISEYHTCRLLYPLIANKLIRLRERSHG